MRFGAPRLLTVPGYSRLSDPVTATLTEDVALFVLRAPVEGVSYLNLSTAQPALPVDGAWAVGFGFPSKDADAAETKIRRSLQVSLDWHSGTPRSNIEGMLESSPRFLCGGDSGGPVIGPDGVTVYGIHTVMGFHGNPTWWQRLTGQDDPNNPCMGDTSWAVPAWSHAGWINSLRAQSCDNGTTLGQSQCLDGGTERLCVAPGTAQPYLTQSCSELGSLYACVAGVGCTRGDGSAAPPPPSPPPGPTCIDYEGNGLPAGTAHCLANGNELQCDGQGVLREVACPSGCDWATGRCAI